MKCSDTTTNNNNNDSNGNNKNNKIKNLSLVHFMVTEQNNI